MEKLNFLQSGKEPPHRLYHYTSVKGLEGILTSHSLWATQIHFLNDTQEFKYAVHILRQVLSELQKEYPITSKALGPSPLPSKPEELLAEFYSKIADNLVLDLVERTPICVFSLSEKGDLLSQWRGYCPLGGGYSVGFSTKLLIPFLQTRDSYIASCVYDEKEQQTIVRRTIAEKSEILLKSLSGLPSEIEQAMKKCFIDFLNEFSQIASILKHPSFHEECEWRIITAPIKTKDMSFRVGKSMLIPYCSISFEGMEHFPIDKIIIGPAPEQDLAETSLSRFLLRNKLHISIETSKTPYRVL